MWFSAGMATTVFTPLPISLARSLVFSTGKQRFRVNCCLSSSSPTEPEAKKKCESRRIVILTLLFIHSRCSLPNYADASSIFDKYVKRKKLEPLEAYVPAVLLTQLQFKYLEKMLEDAHPEYSVSRSLLRSGPAASLRVNIRAVAQYASDDGKGKAASSAVDQCLGALEDLDSLLLRASRNDPTATVESMGAKVKVALGALDSLLQTVPPAILDKGKAIADAYNTPSDSAAEDEPKDLDPDVKQLEELL